MPSPVHYYHTLPLATPSRAVLVLDTTDELRDCAPECAVLLDVPDVEAPLSFADMLAADDADAPTFVCLACNESKDADDFDRDAMDCHECRALRLERRLFALQLAVDMFLKAPKIGGQYSRALMALRAMSKNWQVSEVAS